MKKFLKDLKVSELVKICKKYQGHYCENCPLLLFCNSVSYHPLEKAFEVCVGVIEV